MKINGSMASRTSAIASFPGRRQSSFCGTQRRVLLFGASRLRHARNETIGLGATGQVCTRRQRWEGMCEQPSPQNVRTGHENNEQPVIVFLGKKKKKVSSSKVTYPPQNDIFHQININNLQKNLSCSCIKKHITRTITHF
jgi:hypothetical protein